MQLEMSILDLAADDELNLAIEVNGDLLRLLMGPGAGWAERYVPAAQISMSQLAKAMGNKSMALNHANEAIKWNVLLQGPQSPDTLSAIELARSCRNEL